MDEVLTFKLRKNLRVSSQINKVSGPVLLVFIFGSVLYQQHQQGRILSAGLVLSVIVFLVVIFLLTQLFEKFTGRFPEAGELRFDLSSGVIEGTLGESTRRIDLQDVTQISVVKDRLGNVTQIVFKGPGKLILIHEYENLSLLAMKIKEYRSSIQVEEMVSALSKSTAYFLILFIALVLTLLSQGHVISWPGSIYYLPTGFILLFIKPWSRVSGKQFEKYEFRTGIVLIAFGAFELLREMGMLH